MRWSCVQDSSQHVTFWDGLSSSRTILSWIAHACIFISVFPYFTGIPVRLQGPLSGNGTGRVEIFYRGQWGSICDKGWDMNEAKVVCRELGYGYAVRVLKRGEVPVGVGKIWLDDVACSGSEKNVSSCSHGEWGSHRCNQSEVVGVECSLEGNFSTGEGGIGRWVG